MPKKTVEFYEIHVKMSIRKKYWDEQYPDGEKVLLTPKEISERIQCGIEVPLEDVKVEILK